MGPWNSSGVSRLFLTVDTGVQSQAKPCGIYGGHNDIEACISPDSLVSADTDVSRMFHRYLYITDPMYSWQLTVLLKQQ